MVSSAIPQPYLSPDFLPSRHRVCSLSLGVIFSRQCHNAHFDRSSTSTSYPARIFTCACARARHGTTSPKSC